VATTAQLVVLFSHHATQREIQPVSSNWEQACGIGQLAALFRRCPKGRGGWRLLVRETHPNPHLTYAEVPLRNSLPKPPSWGRGRLPLLALWDGGRIWPLAKSRSPWATMPTLIAVGQTIRACTSWNPPENWVPRSSLSRSLKVIVCHGSFGYLWPPINVPQPTRATLGLYIFQDTDSEVSAENCELFPHPFNVRESDFLWNWAKWMDQKKLKWWGYRVPLATGYRRLGSQN